MATLQKFKLLATQCAVAGSPTRSPTTSPVIHLRRRKTLRMLLSRSGGGGGGGRRLPPRPGDESSGRIRSDDSDESPEKRKDTVVSHKLRDLFISSPPQFEERTSANVREGISPAEGMDGRRGGSRPLRPLSATLRQRLLRRAWRPMLGAIPESHFEN